MDYRFAALDFETDPWHYGRLPLPFYVGVYDGDFYWECWGADLVPQKFNPLWAFDSERLLEYRRAVAKATVSAFLDFTKYWERTIFYAHNGGKFDYHFMIEHFTGAMKIINARIVKARIGRHEFRDSYAILPVPLATFGGKSEIEYEKMEIAVRDKHRAEIGSYLKQDCVTLWENVLAFCQEFSPHKPPRLTMASTAMLELTKLHKFDKLTDRQDEFLRPYFFGGRCQCFEVGILKGEFECADVRSMYPDAMASINHPIGNEYSTGTRITPHTFFLTVEAENMGAFARRKENNALSFAHGEGVYNTTIHEYNAALETGTANIKRVIRTIDFKKAGTFEEFISHFYQKRLGAKSQNKISHITFYKLIMNGAYGKFAQNCADFMDYKMLRELELDDTTWEIAYEGPNYFIYERPARLRLFGYYNVATGASITGAARAKLLRGLSASIRPLYSDTDSIICERMALATENDNRLGTWAIEARGTMLAVAGKKTYALFSDKPDAIAEVKEQIAARKKTADYLVTIGGVKYACVKKASKGVNLSPLEIYRVAKGDTVEFPNPVPNFRLAGNHRFVTRRIRATG